MRRNLAFPSDRGLTVLEILITGVLFLILISSFAYSRRSKARFKVAHFCDEQAWRWTRAADEIEMKLRRWEMWGGACLKVGVSPVGVTQGDHIEFWDIQAARPIVRPMVLPGLMEVVAAQPFVVGQSLFVCEESTYVSAKVIHALQGGGDLPTPVEVDYPEKDKQRKFAAGALVATVIPMSYQSVMSETPPIRYLYEKIGEKQRLVTSGFENFLLQMKDDGEHKEVQVNIGFSRGECAIQREISLRSADIASAAGEWQYVTTNPIYRPFDIRKEIK